MPLRRDRLGTSLPTRRHRLGLLGTAASVAACATVAAQSGASAVAAPPRRAPRAARSSAVSNGPLFAVAPSPRPAPLALRKRPLLHVGAPPRTSSPAAVRRTELPRAVIHPGVAGTAQWCTMHGSAVAAWTDTTPNLPICGPGPAYGGSWSYVDLPGPRGRLSAYYNATPGFQCVELAERWLSIADGLAPVMAEGDQVAANYHAAYPNSRYVVNGTATAIGHAPVAGDVISFSSVPDFNGANDGHVAIVVASHVSPAGNGTILVAQENVGPSAYHKVLDLIGWRLVDPSDPADAEFQYPYAAWFHLLPPPRAVLAAEAAQHRAAEVAALRRRLGTERARGMLAALLREHATPTPRALTLLSAAARIPPAR